MQFRGKSGTMYPNQMQASSDAGDSSAPDQSGARQPITDNPEAMQCVDKLQQMGYTADDVEQAMGGGDDQGQAPAAPAKAAPMSIPSMG